MTAVNTAQRSTHGRILLLGGGAGLAESLEAALPARPEPIETLYDAIGEIATAPARAPVDLVIMSARIAARLTDASMRAVRRIDPAVRFVLIQEDGDPDRTPRELFDACLRSRHDTATLLSMIGLANGTALTAAEQTATSPNAGPAAPRMMDDASAIPREAAQADDPADASSSRPAATPAARASSKSSPPSPAPDTVPPAPSVEAGASPPPNEDPLPPEAPAPQTGTGHASRDEPLGDTDLIDAMLHAPDGARPVAIELIVQQTGWTDLTWQSDPAAECSPGGAIAVVRQDSRTFGALTSAIAGANELTSWADWLARWLTLDARYREYRLLAFRDDLTGAWNRRYFDSFLSGAIENARARRRPITVMVFDVDDFKHYNDQYGHAAGDEILRETVRLLASVIRRGDRVCRIGGDEFAVIFADVEGPRAAGSAHPESVEQIAQRFQNEVCQMHFPKLGIEAPGTLSISAGLATYPWDGGDASSLLQHADELALESKRKGKNILTFGPGASAVCRGKSPEA